MSTSLWFLNRIVAPFLCGFCLAAPTAVRDPYAIAFFVVYAGTFAFLGFELGSRTLARFKQRTA